MPIFLIHILWFPFCTVSFSKFLQICSVIYLPKHHKVFSFIPLKNPLCLEKEITSFSRITQWTGVWVDCGSWLWTGRPGMLWFMGHKESDMTDWTELNSHFPHHCRPLKAHHCLQFVTSCLKSFLPTCSLLHRGTCTWVFPAHHSNWIQQMEK